MKRIFFILFLCSGVVNGQAFEELEGEDKSELKTGKYEGTICEIPRIAEFPGGMGALHLFLYKNLKSPKKDTCSGEKILVSFTVDINGILTDIVVEGTCKAYIDEVLRVISIMPNWIPAKHGNHTVKERFRLPIIFKKE